MKNPANPTNALPAGRRVMVTEFAESPVEAIAQFVEIRE